MLRFINRPRNLGDAKTYGIELEAKARMDEFWADAPASLHRQDISGAMAGETRGPIAAKARHAGLRPAAQDAACSSLARCKASISSASKPASSRACRLNGPCR